MPARCIPCLSPEVKKVIGKEFPIREILDILERIADCPAREPPIQLCGKDGRKRSAYQVFLSSCLKGKVKGIGTAGPALKECARQWKETKHGRG